MNHSYAYAQCNYNDHLYLYRIDFFLYTKYFLCTYTTYFHQELKIKKKGRNVTVIVTKETTKREK